jgi:hypothetical protein
VRSPSDGIAHLTNGGYALTEWAGFVAQMTFFESEGPLTPDRMEQNIVPFDYINQTSEPFPALQLALPKSRILLANADTRTLSFLATDAQRSSQNILIQQRFSPSEWQILDLLLQSFPQAVEHNHLFALFYHISPQQSRRRLDAAQRNGQLREILRPLRGIITSLRRKLRPFSLGIAVQQGISYAIIVHR